MTHRQIRFLHAGLALLLLGSCGPQYDSIVPNLNRQLTLYPDMGTEDFYKFVHQAAFGNKHLFEHGHAEEMLQEEWSELSPDSSGPLTEDLTPDGRVVRLNLRPYKASGGDPGKLWTAMQRSADAGYPGIEAIEQWWEEIYQEATLGSVPVFPSVLKSYFEERRREGFPAVHHSPSFNEAYRPAYRVLLREEVRKLLQ